MFLIICIVYFIIGLTSDNPYFFVSLLSVMLAITPVSLYAYDEMAKWDVYALTMPLSREKIVRARYMTMLLLALIGAVIGSFLTILVSLFTKQDISMEGFSSIGYGSSVIIMILSISIPFIIKFGVERARVIFVALYILPFMIGLLIKKQMDKGGMEIPAWLIEAISFFKENVLIILPLAVLLVLLISYYISVSIYRKKDM